MNGTASRRSLADRLAGEFADPVGAVADAFDGGLHLGQRILFARDEAEGEIAVKGIGAGVGHVLAVAGKIAGVLLGGTLEGLLGVLAQGLEHMVAEVDAATCRSGGIFRAASRRSSSSAGAFPALPGLKPRMSAREAALMWLGVGGRLEPSGRIRPWRRPLAGLPAGDLGRLRCFFSFFFAISRTSSRLNAIGLARLAFENAAFEIVRLRRFHVGDRDLGAGRLGPRPAWCGRAWSRTDRRNLFHRRGGFLDGLGGFLGGGGLLFLGHDGRGGLAVKGSGVQGLVASRADFAMRGGLERGHPAPAAGTADEAPFARGNDVDGAGLHRRRFRGLRRGRRSVDSARSS